MPCVLSCMFRIQVWAIGTRLGETKLLKDFLREASDLDGWVGLGSNQETQLPVVFGAQVKWTNVGNLGILYNARSVGKCVPDFRLEFGLRMM